MARKFFYVCAGMLMLALSYHFGASTAIAQAPGNALVAAIVDPGTVLRQIVYTANGDVYETTDRGASWSHVSNVFAGAPTPARQESWGSVKSRYR